MFPRPPRSGSGGPLRSLPYFSPPPSAWHCSWRNVQQRVEPRGGGVWGPSGLAGAPGWLPSHGCLALSLPLGAPLPLLDGGAVEGVRREGILCSALWRNPQRLAEGGGGPPGGPQPHQGCSPSAVALKTADAKDLATGASVPVSLRSWILKGRGLSVGGPLWSALDGLRVRHAKTRFSLSSTRQLRLRGKGPPVLCGLYRVSCGGLPSPQQIRAHFAAAGCPLVNDEAYSESSSSHTRDVDSGGNSTASEDPYGHQISGAQQEGPPLAVELCGSHADSEPFYPTLFSVTLAEGVNLQQKTPCDTRTAGVKQSSLTAASSSKKKEDSARCSTLGLQLCCLTFPDPLGPRMGQSFTVSVEGPPDWPQE
ncbi:hypothetical protein cyc_04895 [Cyclospora cayetanensis]|uniref:Uncharacterized protein n=1 Tax=Cyclospora cayetanensis TaxID=88456 RepID=A0A1D3D0J1_9EIME|nr:hypothetical protein cyc_04895 [Cyclospora cayetanensis]